MKCLLLNEKRYNFFKKKSFDFFESALNRKDINNFYDKSYNYYLYSFFIKKNFIKFNLNPIFSKNKSDIFLKNFFKNKSYSQSFLQNSLKGGNKLKMMCFLNKMRSNFYFFFLKKIDFFQKKFPTYSIYYNFSKTEKKFFDFDFILNILLKNNESIFFTKAVRLNKKIKQKNKTKLKYNVEVQYLKSDKRNYFTLKQIHLFSNNYNFYNYDERLLMSFFNAFFFEKNSDIYKNKIITYKNVLKKNSK